MSYCRFSSGWKKGKATLGDVYLYADVNGMFCCCSCKLLRKVRNHREISVWLADRSAAILHLQHHKLAGHKFPSYAERELRKELIEVGERFNRYRDTKCNICAYKVVPETEKAYKRRIEKLRKDFLKRLDKLAKRSKKLERETRRSVAINEPAAIGSGNAGDPIVHHRGSKTPRVRR